MKKANGICEVFKNLVFFYFLIISLSFQTFSQEIHAIDTSHIYKVNWVETLSWKELKKKAKDEKKFIFLDCYTTWCAPCKWMDRNVFVNKNVVDILNRNFLSFRIQMDSTIEDSELVRSRYSDAVFLKETYLVSGFPTYLFFTSEGGIIHKEIGAKKANEFIQLLQGVANGNKRYYELLSKYENGEKDTFVLKHLALSAKDAGYKDLSNKVAEEYLQAIPINPQFSGDLVSFLTKFEKGKTARDLAKIYKAIYLDELSLEKLITANNLQFLRKFYFLITSTDNSFNIFYNYPHKVDSILKLKGVSESIVLYTIKQDEIERKLWFQNMPVVNEPDWSSLEKIIKIKYGSYYHKKLFPSVQIEFYKRIKNWRKFAHLKDKEIRKTHFKANEPLSKNGTWGINVDAWFLFQHSDDRKSLKSALKWINLAIKLEDNSLNQYLDTKANILYKLGFVKEAIALEEKALQMEIEFMEKNGKRIQESSEFLQTLSKMKKGIPTWDVK